MEQKLHLQKRRRKRKKIKSLKRKQRVKSIRRRKKLQPIQIAKANPVVLEMMNLQNQKKIDLDPDLYHQHLTRATSLVMRMQML